MTAFERAQTVAEQAALAGLQFNRQRQVFEAQAFWRMVEELNVHRLAEVVFDFQAHLTPTAECQAAGHLPSDARCWQTVQTQRIQRRQSQQREQQSPVDRYQARRDIDLQCAQRAQHNADEQQEGQPDQQQARGFHRRGAGTWSSNCAST
ncbi:hypothetical protein D3C81_1295330 [compost metagenome]